MRFPTAKASNKMISPALLNTIRHLSLSNNTGTPLSPNCEKHFQIQME